MNHIEFRVQFVRSSDTRKYIPTVALYDLDTNKVIGTKYFKEEDDAEAYKKLAERKLATEEETLDDILSHFHLENH